MYMNIGRQLEINDAVVHLKMAKNREAVEDVVEVVENIVIVVRSAVQAARSVVVVPQK
jgi:hypothetical protein